MLENKKTHKGRIRGLLRRKGVTPITSGDIVIISSREYESCAGKADAIFDIVGVMSKKDAKELEKIGKIPEWMMSSTDDSTDKAPTNEGYEFDYSEETKDKEDEDSDEDVDVDNV
jgi:hypothetical protein